MTDQTYNKIELATQQINVAISYFLKRRSLVSALTLASAAEKIFSKALAHRGQQNFLDSKYETLEPNPKMRGLSKEDFVRDENSALNAIKEMDAANDTSVTLDLEEAAYSMIVRACDNYDRLGLPRTAKMRELDNYFYEHVVGPADSPEVGYGY